MTKPILGNNLLLSKTKSLSWDKVVPAIIIGEKKDITNAVNKILAALNKNRNVEVKIKVNGKIISYYFTPKS
mgnify:CR=1 FL=1